MPSPRATSGLGTDEDDFLALSAALGRFVGVEYDFTDGRARRGGKSLDEDVALGFRVKLRMEQLLDLLGGDARNGGLGVDEALVEHIHGDSDGSGGSALSVSRLEYVELALLYRELDVLSVAVVVLKELRYIAELLVDFRHGLAERGDGHRRADTRDDVFALRVDEVFAEELVFAGRGASREADAGAAVVAEVAEYHRYDVDRRAVVLGDVVDLAVGDGARRVPAAEDGVDGEAELLPRVGREGVSGVGDYLLVVFDELLELFGRDFVVFLDSRGVSRLLEALFKFVEIHAEHDVREHLDEAAVAVVGESLVSGRFREGLHSVVVEAEVQYGVHHAGHRDGGSRTDGYEKRVLGGTEVLSGELLYAADGGFHVAPDSGYEVVFFPVLMARLSGNYEARRHRKPDLPHLREVRAFAAKEQAHVRAAFAEIVDVLS